MLAQDHVVELSYQRFLRLVPIRHPLQRKDANSTRNQAVSDEFVAYSKK